MVPLQYPVSYGRYDFHCEHIGSGISWQWSRTRISMAAVTANPMVAWYCLANIHCIINHRMMRNNYYFYSRGNLSRIVGHSTVSNEEEIKLFINAMVAAANVTAVDPEVNFVEELNPTADIEKTRYYSTDQSAWT